MLADGSTPISVGQNLTLKQLSDLRFKPNPGAIPQSSLFKWNETAPGGTTTSRSVALPFDSSTATPTVTSPPIGTAKPDPTAALTATATPDPTSTATPTLTSNTSLVATATQSAVSNGATPGSYNAVFGLPLDIDVPSEAPSSLTAQVTGLPTNGTVVMSDGNTPVSVGQSLTPAQAGELPDCSRASGSRWPEARLRGRPSPGGGLSFSLQDNLLLDLGPALGALPRADGRLPFL